MYVEYATAFNFPCIITLEMIDLHDLLTVHSIQLSLQLKVDSQLPMNQCTVEIRGKSIPLFVDRGEEGQPRQFLLLTTFSSFSRPEPPRNTRPSNIIFLNSPILQYKSVF